MAILTNLVGAWSLDESSGNAADASGNGNTLTNEGTTPYSSAKINNGADFNTTNNRRLSSTSALSFDSSTDYSWAGWVKFNAIGQYCLDHGKSGANATRVLIYTDTSGGNKVHFWAASNEIVSSVISTGTYYWLCLVKTGTSFEAFLDNVSQGTTTLGAATASTTYFSLGASGDSFGSKLNGQMDIWSVWNRALDSTDRSTLYNGGAGVQYPFSLSQIKTVDGLATASVKTINGLATASVKTVNGLTNV